MESARQAYADLVHAATRGQAPVGPRGAPGRRGASATARRRPDAGPARGPRWARTGSGLFVPSEVERDVVQQRIVEWAARMPAYAAVTGWAACLLHGAAFLDGRAVDGTTELPVGIVVGTRGSMRRDPGIVLSFEALREWDVVTPLRRAGGRPRTRGVRRDASPGRAGGAGGARVRARRPDHVAASGRGIRAVTPQRAQVQPWSRGHCRGHGAECARRWRCGCVRSPRRTQAGRACW